MARIIAGIVLAALIGPLRPAAAVERPVAIAPGGNAESLLQANSCPTFHWGGGQEAAEMEVVVLRLAEEEEASGEEAVLRVRLPGVARGWTPSLAQCLERGARYAWLVGAVGEDGSMAWSEAQLFELAPAPSIEEVEAALAVLAEQRDGETDGSDEAPGGLSATRLGEGGKAGSRRLTAAERARAQPGSELRRIPAKGVWMGAIAGQPLLGAAAPGLGFASLNLAGDVKLSSTTTFFKDSEVFLWDDDFLGITALGRRALASNVPGGGENTAVGTNALFSNRTGSGHTAVGRDALLSNTIGFNNVAVGAHALASNTSGSFNTAVGRNALGSNTTGSSNIALGNGALAFNTTGSFNVAFGEGAGGDVTTGNNNIQLGSGSGVGAPGTIRIGGAAVQDRTFIAGIRGVTTGRGDAVGVLIDSLGQLGTVNSSRRLKEEIQNMGEDSNSLLALRPVTFRYTAQRATGDRRLHHGLIAEEVADVLPDLVAYGADGEPETVLYHELVPMLLNELQKLDGRVATQEATIQELRRRLAADSDAGLDSR